MRFKKDFILLGIMAIVAFGAAGLTIVSHPKSDLKARQLCVMASFYPMYVIGLNVADGVEGVSVRCMTENQTGCLHDYQMTTEDMKALESSDVFLMNGGGMESFLDSVLANYPELFVVNAGKGLEDNMLSGHSHEGEEEANAHFWLHPEYYKIQIQNTADGFAMLDPDHAAMYQDNAQRYIAQVEKMAEKYQKELVIPQGSGVIVFHDAFAYLADYLGMNVIHIVEMDGETSMSAGEVAEVIEEVREHNVQILFTEAQYSREIAETITRETDAVFYVINSLVTGDGTKDSYLRGMQENFEALKEAFHGA